MSSKLKDREGPLLQSLISFGLIPRRLRRSFHNLKLFPNTPLLAAGFFIRLIVNAHHSPISRATHAGNGLPKETRVAVLFQRFGPYHHARLNAAGKLMRVFGVEACGMDVTYAWAREEGAAAFTRITLTDRYASDLRWKRKLSRAMRRALNEIKPDVVVVPGWSSPDALSALVWCGETRTPVVMMSESTAWDDSRSGWKEWIKRQLLGACSAGLVGGKAHADYLEQLGMERNRIFLGYDIVDNDYFAAKTDEIRSQVPGVGSQHGLPKNFFLASARFIPKKNLPRLIRAYSRYREMASTPSTLNSQLSTTPWDLVLLGDGPLRETLDAQLSTLNLRGHVLLPGFKQYGELPVYYGLAKAFIHASTIEQWGLVVNEAMASGLPVLVSERCGCAGDLVREGRNGFSFNPYDVEALAQLMLKVSADNFPLSEFGSASRQIIQEWSPDKFAASMKAACEVAVSKSRSERSLAGLGMAGLMIKLPDKVLGKFSESADSLGKFEPERSPSIKIAPNFFVIGAPKSGTTALCEYLKDHPNIFFSPIKEPHFFDLDCSNQLKLNLQTYLSLFSEAEPDLHKAVGEGSTGYLFSKVAVPEILKFNPNSKFIVILRNPVELVQSWHSEMYFEGVENVADFEKAWKLERERRQGRNIPSPCWEPKKLFYSEWGKLGDQVERLLAAVRRDRLKLILFDDFVADTKGVYEEVLSFLGVPLDGRKDFQVVNENKTLRFPWLQRNLAFTANHFRRLRVVSGLKLNLGSGVSHKLLHLNSRPITRKRISPELRAELADFFREDVQKLSKLLGRDLSHWVAKIHEPERMDKGGPSKASSWRMP